MSKSTEPTTARAGEGQCRFVLLALCSLLGFGLVGAASAQPDQNSGLAGDCDDTFVAKSDSEYICEQTQAAAMYSKIIAENTSGETWVCLRLANVDITRPDADGFAFVTPAGFSVPAWINLATTDRLDRFVETGNSDVILPPWAMRIAPVYARDGDVLAEQRNLSRTFVRVPDAECRNAPFAGDPTNVEIMPQP